MNDRSLRSLAAYVLAADPAWIEQSISSYYDAVCTIFVSYDVEGRGWTGLPIQIDECLERIRRVDPEQKVRKLPGHWAAVEQDALMAETRQRQCAIDAASHVADWVLQIDTDEILPVPERFLQALANCAATDAEALDYPSRVFRQRTARGFYLENCSRFWRATSSYPGAMAVKAGTRLRLARQTEAPHYRVDVRPRNTDPARHADARVDEVVKRREAILHPSWVRSDDEMRSKLASWGHAAAFSGEQIFDDWKRAGRRPLRTALKAPVGRRSAPLGRLRLARVPMLGDHAQVK
jgi:hypothetical protein